MTNPTLERAARAAREYMESVNADEHTADVLTLGVVRAVLMAVREPDQAVLSAKTPLGPMHRYGQWTAMIDAILEEGE